MISSNVMTIGMSMASEMEEELALCRQIIERIPTSLLGWQPHKRSPSMGELSVHIAAMVEWIKLAATTEELDYAIKPYKQVEPASTDALLGYFDDCAGGTVEAVRGLSDERMHALWTVRNGERIYFTKPRVEVIRIDCLNHIIHHRGQLTIYFRLNDIALPGIYGPNGDE